MPATGHKHFDDLFECFLDIHCLWLVDGCHIQFHYVDTLLTYALGAGKEFGRKLRVQ